MPAYGNPPHDPATLSDAWQPTGQARIRSAWFGVLIVEVEQSRMVQVGPRQKGHALGSWREVKRWRRARRGHVIRLGADLFAAYRQGKAERH
jgi:hypothetical protein